MHKINYLNHIINKINSNNFKTTPSSGLNSTKSSKEKNKTKINIRIIVTVKIKK